MKITLTVRGVNWTIKNPSGMFGGWPPLSATATTAGHTTVFNATYAPTASSWAHEFYHVLHTSWLRYLWSYTAGRIYGSKYWCNEEKTANEYGLAHAGDLDFTEIAKHVKSLLPVTSQDAIIKHSTCE